MTKLSVQFTVNGDERQVLVRPDETLLELLRDELDLKGSKRGCNGGACGSCNVLMDGHSVRSCLTLAANVDGAEVTTVEGLSTDGNLSLVQEAFLEAGAIQCGFCMPGMIISATELLTENASPDREEIRAALAGNLCRCSGYVKVIQAVELAARKLTSLTAQGEAR